MTRHEVYTAIHDRLKAHGSESPEWAALHALVALGLADENGNDSPHADGIRLYKGRGDHTFSHPFKETP